MAAATVLNFGQMAFLVIWSNSWFYFVPSYKIWAKSLNPGEVVAIFPKSKMAAVHYFESNVVSFEYFAMTCVCVCVCVKISFKYVTQFWGY